MTEEAGERARTETVTLARKDEGPWMNCAPEYAEGHRSLGWEVATFQRIDPGEVVLVLEMDSGAYSLSKGAIEDG